MMRRTTTWMIASMALAAAACSTKDAPPPQAATDNGSVKTEAPADQAPTNPEGSEAEVSAPFVLTVEGPDKLPENSEFAIVVKIRAHHEFKVPATINLVLPQGVTLNAAERPTETLPSIPAGETVRTFHVTASGALATPIKVVLDARDPGKAFGAHAEKTYPSADAKPAQRPSSAVPPPPVGRPMGAPVPAAPATR